MYGYVYDTLNEIDPFGLTWKDLLASGLGHHLFPRSVSKKLGIPQLAKLTALSWYPNVTEGSGEVHQLLHKLLRDAGVPFHGSKFTGDLDDFWNKAMKAYEGLDGPKYKGYLKIPGTSDAKVAEEFMNLTPKEGLQKIKELLDSGKLDIIAPCKLKS